MHYVNDVACYDVLQNWGCNPLLVGVSNWVVLGYIKQSQSPPDDGVSLRLEPARFVLKVVH